MPSPWLSMTTETEEEKKKREALEKMGSAAQPQGTVEQNQKTIANFFRKR